MRKTRSRDLACLALIVLITLAAADARLVGIGFDGFSITNHDERFHLLTAEHFYRGVINPREIWEERWFLHVFYGWVSMYIVAAVYRLYDLILLGAAAVVSGLAYLAGEGGKLLSGCNFPPPGFEPRRAVILGRLTVALFGTATVPLLYLIGKRLFNRRTGLLAAALLAVNGYHVAHCHWMKNDIIAVFFFTAAFFFAVRIFLRGRLSDYLLAAAFSAVAINTKQYCVPILATCLFAHLLAGGPLTFRGLAKRLLAGKVLFSVLVFLAVFVATYPLLYLDFGWAVSKFREMATQARSDWLFYKMGHLARPRSFLQIRLDNLKNFALFAWGMEVGMGPYVLLLALGGVAAAIWTRRRRFLLAASLPLVYLPALCLVASPGIRYYDLIPLFPVSALLAAAFIWLVSKSVGKKSPRAAGAAMALAGLLVLIPYGRAVVGMDYGYWQRSVRYFANRWSPGNIPPGSTVFRESKTVSPERFLYRSKQVRALWNHDVEALAASGVDYLAVASRHEQRALEETGLYGPEHPFGKFYLALPSRYELIKEFDLGVIPNRGGGIKIWKLKQDHPLAPTGINSALLRRVQNDLSFSSPDLLFAGPAGRCEGTTSFIVPPGETAGRLIISSDPIPRIGVQVTNGPCAGRARIRPGSGKLTAEFAAGQARQFVVSPRAGFPFIQHSYRVSVSSPRNSPCLVRVLTGPYRIGLGYFATGDYSQAIPWLEEAARADNADWYPRALLSAAWARNGNPDKAEHFRLEAERIYPGYREIVSRLRDGETGEESWAEEFENQSGFSPAWLAERAGRTWHQDEWEEEVLPDGFRRITIGDIRLPPGEYLIRPEWESSLAPAEIGVRFFRGDNVLYRWVFPGEDEEVAWSMVFENRELSAGFQLVLDVKGPAPTRILIRPPVKSVRSRVSEYLRELEPGGEGRN